MSDYHGVSIALEAIDIQDGSFFKEMTALFAPHVGSKPDNEVQKRLAKGIEKCIDKHTGLSTELVFSHSGTCIYVPLIDRNNSLLASWRLFYNSNDGIKMINAGEGLSMNHIDMAKGRVSGDFSKYTGKINVDLAHFTGGYSAEEVAAVVLHEVGHFFTYLEMIDRTCSTNLVLAGLDRALRGNDPKQREIALRKVGDVWNMPKEVVEDAVNSTSDKAVVTIYVTQALNYMRSQTGHSFYDANGFEMASDQFAARHGAGRHLVTALDKIYHQYGHVAVKSRTMYLLMQVFSVLKLTFFAFFAVASLTAIIATPVAAIAMSLLSAFTLHGMLNTAHMVDGVPTYDKPKDRALRVRRELIEASRQPGMLPEIAKALIEDVRAIDETVALYHNDEAWLETAMNFLSKSHRERRDSVNLQKQLESLALNDLFLKSLELKHA